MHQLLYISTRSAAFVPSDATQILDVSRRNNAAVGVTGMLLFNGRRFLQALEGEPDAVAATFDRIRADPRHIAVVTLSSRTVVTREFGTWAMAHGDAVAGGEAALLDQVDRLTAAASPNTRAHFLSYAALRAA